MAKTIKELMIIKTEKMLIDKKSIKTNSNTNCLDIIG